MLAVTLVVAGCGDTPPEPARPSGLTAAQLTALTSELAAAGPQGQVTATQAAETADRQARIASTYAERTLVNECRTSLERLASAYTTFGRAAEAFATDSGRDQQYAQAGGRIASALEKVESVCA